MLSRSGWEGGRTRRRQASPLNSPSRTPEKAQHAYLPAQGPCLKPGKAHPSAPVVPSRSPRSNRRNLDEHATGRTKLLDRNSDSEMQASPSVSGSSACPPQLASLNTHCLIMVRITTTIGIFLGPLSPIHRAQAINMVVCVALSVQLGPSNHECFYANVDALLGHSSSFVNCERDKLSVRDRHNSRR